LVQTTLLSNAEWNDGETDSVGKEAHSDCLISGENRKVIRDDCKSVGRDVEDVGADSHSADGRARWAEGNFIRWGKVSTDGEEFIRLAEGPIRLMEALIPSADIVSRPVGMLILPSKTRRVELETDVIGWRPASSG
jgi:hypothetical protein